MCELFAMSALQPAEVSFSLEEFSQHGGLSGPHKDGWGIAFYQDRDALIIREPLPAASSAYVRFIESTPIRSRLVLSHIRRATQGGVNLENTQPFARELGGRLHVFAHNGQLDVTQLSERPLGVASALWGRPIPNWPSAGCSHGSNLHGSALENHRRWTSGEQYSNHLRASCG
jgi:predicted glutamine amidotransferase